MGLPKGRTPASCDPDWPYHLSQLEVLFEDRYFHWVTSRAVHRLFMHLTYEIGEESLERGTRQRIIINTLSQFQVEDRSGEVRVPILNDHYGDALYSFVQALLKVSDLTFLSRERVRSTFFEDFRSFIADAVPEDRRQFDWHHPEHDPEAKYPVTCRLNGGPTQIFVYALQNDDHTRDANIALLEFEKWRVNFESVAVFENQEDINRKVLARFTDACDRQYSNLATNRERLAQHLLRGLGLPA